MAPYPEDKWFYEERRVANILKPFDRDTPIYRVFGRQRLLDTISKKELTLTRFRKWEDPYEGFLFRGEGIDKDGHKIGFSSFVENAYGQCWTLLSESDALWRIYSPDKQSAIVRTTVGNIFDKLYGNGEEFCLSLYIGLVAYATNAQIGDTVSCANKHLQNILTDHTGLGPVPFLLTKREEFAHEKEVRILYTPADKHPHRLLDFVPFPIDPNAQFDSIVCDPRIDSSGFDDLRKELVAAGYTGDITKSTLYDPPPRFDFSF